jgi:4-alpha-glucanotransferase
MLTDRLCGILLHPTSLPGHDGIGTLGDEARHFIDVLADMGMSFWQVLPLTPPGCGNSPYSAFSAFAGNPLLIDSDQLSREGDLPLDFRSDHNFGQRVDFAAVSRFKMKTLRQAADSFFAAGQTQRMEDFWEFCNSTNWLHDYALFMSLKQRFNGNSWHQWPADIALHTPETIETFSVELGPEIGVHKYLQWQFFRQWNSLKAYAVSHGIRLVGDLPLFVAYDSVDVWCNRNLFLLDREGRPTSVAGVPPDYFSPTGQLWGNPLYDWGALKEQGYGWWIERFRQLFVHYDVVRIDHFRGFEAAWHVPATEQTAEHGTWVAGPGKDFFDAITAACGNLAIIAEDLGVITPNVEELRDYCGYPGMKILQFAFDSGPDNPYLPHNHVKNCVVYTGTHDNNTTRGWFDGLSPAQRHEVQEYIGCSGEEVVNGMLRMALMSVASSVIIPFQDLLGLPGDSRMNTPGTAEGNWGWRFTWSQVPRHLGAAVSEMLERYGRRRPTVQ